MQHVYIIYTVYTDFTSYNLEALRFNKKKKKCKMSFPGNCKNVYYFRYVNVRFYLFCFIF